jgi:hypothetical protein
MTIARMARAVGIAMVLGAALVAGAGCAIQTASSPPPASPAPAPAPAPATTAGKSDGLPPAPVGTTASGGTITVNGTVPDSTLGKPWTPAVKDSTPSADALAVLATIPDPLGRPTPGTDAPSTTGSAPPPATAPPPGAAVIPAPVIAAPRATPARGDTTAASTAADTALGDSTAVPTPEPTQPLGDRPGSRPVPETPAAPPAGSAAGAMAPATAAAPVSPDSCWRVQFAAKPERARSEKLKSAAESQLEVPMVIELEKGLYKVRTRDCMSEFAADALKKRAIAAGFDGAFKLRKK